MINNDRIVSVQKTDLLSLYGTFLNLVLSAGGGSVSILETADILGNFEVDDEGTYLANQPVKTLDFPSGVTSGTVYFVAAYDFEGITVAGAAPTLESGSLELDDVQHDCATLYSATLASNKITIAAVTPVVA